MNLKNKPNINHQYLVDGYTHVFENCDYQSDVIYDVFISGLKNITVKDFDLKDVNKILSQYNLDTVFYRLSNSKQCKLSDDIVSGKK